MAIPVGLAIAGLATSLGGSAFRGLTGLRQTRDARRALQNLEEPEMYIPSSIRQRAQEPIAVEFMSAQEDAAARRTGESVGALQKAGARGIIGGVNQVMDSERGQERARMAGYEQERRGALGELGRAQENLQGRQMQNYLSKMQGALRSLEAGQQNISGALGDVSSLGQSVVGGYLMQGDDNKKNDGGISIGDTNFAAPVFSLPTKGIKRVK